MSQDLVLSLQKQNRLLKGGLSLAGLGFTALLLVAAKAPFVKQQVTELDVERINIVSADGKRELVISNRQRLPGAVIDGKEALDQRKMPGLIFYNEAGDECGGLIWKGKLDEKGNPAAGMHFSMDRLGGDQQLALGQYEDNGSIEAGLNIYDRGLAKDYQPLWDAMKKAPQGPERDALRAKWEAAGGRQTPRVFVGKTRGKSSAVILADASGKPRIMLLVTPDGKPTLNFMDEKGSVIQSLPEKKS